MDLQNLVAATKTVPFLNGTVDIVGLSLRKVTDLIVRYPDLLALAAGKSDIANLIIAAPEAAMAVVALGIKSPSEDQTESVLRAFEDAPVGQQIDLIGGIVELTFAGERARPFLARFISPPSSAPASPDSVAAAEIPAATSQSSSST